MKIVKVHIETEDWIAEDLRSKVWSTLSCSTSVEAQGGIRVCLDLVPIRNRETKKSKRNKEIADELRDIAKKVEG